MKRGGKFGLKLFVNPKKRREKMKKHWRSFYLVGLLFLGIILSLFAGCAPDAGTDEVIGVKTQSLDANRTRVIRECSQAMSGSWWWKNETNWPIGTTYGFYSYISNDLGAWGRLLDNTYNYGVRGWWTSCRSTKSPDVVNYDYPDYPKCQLEYGDLDTASLYDCQGICTSGIRHRGGQCKPFMNLVAYRSGLYQNPGYAWKSFPTDSQISSWSTAADQMPYATYSNIEPGDYLRRPYGHALIIVRKNNSSSVVVLDSNYIDGDGNEKIGSHVLGFTGYGGNSDLGDYRVLKCVYNGNC